MLSRRPRPSAAAQDRHRRHQLQPKAATGPIYRNRARTVASHGPHPLFQPQGRWYQLELWLSLIPGAHLLIVRRGAGGPYRGGWSDQFQVVLTRGKPSQVFPDLWDDIRLKGEGYFFREDTYGHPGYTPSGITRRCVALLSPEGGTVLDPFMGTGTTARSAKDLGRRAIGIEIEERYCEIAAKRMSQSVMH